MIPEVPRDRRRSSAVRRAEEFRRKQEAYQRGMIDAMKAVMSTADGRRFVWHVLELSGIYIDPAVLVSWHGSDQHSETLDPVQATYMNLGRQKLGRILHEELHTPDLIGMFRQMQDEAARTQELGKEQADG